MRAILAALSRGGRRSLYCGLTCLPQGPPLKRLLSLLPVSLLVACVSAPPPDAKVAHADKKMECHREKPPGLLRTVTVCREVDHVKDMEKSAKSFMEERREGKWEQ